MTYLNLVEEKNDGALSSTLASILIVEDDVATATALREALSRRNFHVTCVHSGMEALDILDVRVPNLILLDACLPDIDGFAVCEKIRKMHGSDSVPIYMITGLHDSSSIEKAFLSGANDYIAKPYNTQVLCNRLTYMFINKPKRVENNESSSIMYAMRLWNDFVVELDEKSNLLIDYSDLPEQLHQLLCKASNFEALSKRACKRQRKCFSNSHSEPAFWISASDSKKNTYYYRFQRINHVSGSHYLVIVDDSENMNEAASLYVNGDTGLPNQAKLSQQLQDSANGQEAMHCQNVATMYINNYVNVLATMGENTTIKYIKYFIQHLYKAAENLDIAPIVFHTQKDTLVLIDNESCESKFRKFVTEVANPMLEDSLDQVFTFNIGVAHNTLKQHNAYTLLKNSSRAAHVEMRLPNQINFYEPAMEAQCFKRECMVTLLKRDIEREVLELYFQPKFNAKTLALTGLEALLRWHCDELGVVSPGEFIPVAESTNMMRPLSMLVIEKALSQIAYWIDTHALNVPVSINLDATNLSDAGLVNCIITSVEALAIPPHLLEVEITESVMVTAESDALNNIKKLRSIGIRIAMDDFGTGYSSFSYLHSLPLDVLKIDMSFVREIECDSKMEAIAKAIILIGHEIGLDVIAEGVENQAQLKKLVAMNCDAVQGYLTGKPSRAYECTDFFSGATIADFPSSQDRPD